MTRVAINRELLRWARERAGLAQDELIRRFKRLPEWETGEIQPTLKQVEDFAHAVHVPVGYLFLTKPPEEVVPIPDFRTFAGEDVRRPSPNLLDTIYICQERQSWYRDFVRITRQAERSFVGSATNCNAAGRSGNPNAEYPRLQSQRSARVRDVDRRTQAVHPSSREGWRACDGQRSCHE